MKNKIFSYDVLFSRKLMSKIRGVRLRLIIFWLRRFYPGLSFLLFYLLRIDVKLIETLMNANRYSLQWNSRRRKSNKKKHTPWNFNLDFLKNEASNEKNSFFLFDLFLHVQSHPINCTTNYQTHYKLHKYFPFSIFI